MLYFASRSCKLQVHQYYDHNLHNLLKKAFSHKSWEVKLFVINILISSTAVACSALKKGHNETKKIPPAANATQDLQPHIRYLKEPEGQICLIGLGWDYYWGLRTQQKALTCQGYCGKFSKIGHSLWVSWIFWV